MRVTMVKKRLANGEPCRKCAQTQQMLERRGLWGRIDEVVWALEGQPDSPGLRLASRLGVELAPFFVVTHPDGSEEVFTSALKLIKAHLSASTSTASAPSAPLDLSAAAFELEAMNAPEIVRWGLERFGADCAIAFSGAEDVVVVDMAVRSGSPLSVFSLDTGRLHPETYGFIEAVRKKYGVTIDVMAPQAEALQSFVRTKGLFSFFEDGHKECCGVRKVEPLGRALSGRQAWMTGQRRDQSPTRVDVPVIQEDAGHRRTDGSPLIKLNPLAGWSRDQVWHYIRANEVPYNPLHERGFVSIGCEPCTRPTHPGQHEREGRWWWEETTQRECGLHLPGRDDGAAV